MMDGSVADPWPVEIQWSEQARPMDRSEPELISLARQGDESALREIIERHEHQVAATVTGILGRGPEVDDVGQETFVQFFRSLERFRGDARIATYITRIAINLSLNELKRRKRYAGLPDEELLPDSASGPAGRCGQEGVADIKQIVRRGLEQLAPEFRAVVVLRLIDGFSTKETAEFLNLAEGTVLSRLARGQAKLKEIIGPMIEGRPSNEERDGYGQRDG
jgi:RNA polymerase sigma-70 factor, ECF subfamily